MNYHFIRNLNLYANCIYINSVYYCTLVQSTHGRDFEKFLKFLTRKNLLKVYNYYFSSKPGGSKYSSIFPQVVSFFTTLAWTKPGFYILFTISKVIVPDFGVIYILKPRFLFSYIFLLLRFYVVEELGVNTIDGTGMDILDGLELWEVKSGGYYIMCGDILFSPIKSDCWEKVANRKIASKKIPTFIYNIFYSYYCLDIHKINKSQSKKCYYLSYNKGRHRWSLSSKI